MNFVNPRGDVLTAEKFRERLSRLMATAVEAANVQDASQPTPADPESLKQAAVEQAKKAGLDPNSKQGQAAAGAAMLADTIAAGLKEYERKTGKPAPRHAVENLEKMIAQFSAPPRGKVQDLKKPEDPWKKES